MVAGKHPICDCRRSGPQCRTVELSRQGRDDSVKNRGATLVEAPHGAGQAARFRRLKYSKPMTGRKRMSGLFRSIKREPYDSDSYGLFSCVVNYGRDGRRPSQPFKQGMALPRREVSRATVWETLTCWCSLSTFSLTAGHCSINTLHASSLVTQKYHLIF